MDSLQRKIRSISTIQGNDSVIKLFNYINSPAFCEPSICLNPELINCLCILDCECTNGLARKFTLGWVQFDSAEVCPWFGCGPGRRRELRFSRWNGRPRPLWHPEQPGHCTLPRPSPSAAPARQSRSSSDTLQWMLEPRKRKGNRRSKNQIIFPLNCKTCRKLDTDAIC